MSPDPVPCPSCGETDPSKHGPTEFCAVCKPMPEADPAALVEAILADLGRHQMAMRVVRELIDAGPGSPAALAERMTEKDEDGLEFTTEAVDEAISVLDQWSLIEFQGLEDGDPVALAA